MGSGVVVSEMKDRLIRLAMIAGFFLIWYGSITSILFVRSSPPPEAPHTQSGRIRFAFAVASAVLRSRTWAALAVLSGMVLLVPTVYRNLCIESVDRMMRRFVKDTGCPPGCYYPGCTQPVTSGFKLKAVVDRDTLHSLKHMPGLLACRDHQPPTEHLRGKDGGADLHMMRFQVLKLVATAEQLPTKSVTRFDHPHVREDHGGGGGYDEVTSHDGRNRGASGYCRNLNHVTAASARRGPAT
jgi:hypothetical protein